MKLSIILIKNFSFFIALSKKIEIYTFLNSSIIIYLINKNLTVIIFFMDFDNQQFAIPTTSRQYVPFYIEKDGVGLTEIKYFVDYMMFQRTKDVRVPDVNIYGVTTYISFLQYVPLSDGEEFPDILFTKNSESVPKEFEGPSLPKLNTNRAGKSAADGRYMTPLYNIQQRIQNYYNDGLNEGNHNDLHGFACELNKVFENNFEITTWVENSKRYFKFRNPSCEDPNYFYESLWT